nr:zinc finger, CCHC-type [Tanacetum cinerariifolium]
MFFRFEKSDLMQGVVELRVLELHKALKKHPRVLEVSGFSKLQGCRFFARFLGLQESMRKGYIYRQECGRKSVLKVSCRSGWSTRVNYVYTLDGQVVTRKTLKGRKHLGEYQTGWKIKMARDREQHSTQELFRCRENSNDVAFAIAEAEKIYAHESLILNDTVACEVISKYKAGLKEYIDAQSDVFVLSNGYGKSSDDSDGYYWSIHQVYSYIYLCVYIIWFFLVNSRLRYVLPSPSLLDKAKENVLGMKIVRDQSGNTLMVSQFRCLEKGVLRTEVPTLVEVARDREQHLTQELFRCRENSNDVAFAIAEAEKIYAHESLTLNDTVACEVISKYKAGLKEYMDAQSDVFVLSNGYGKSSDDSDGYYWSIHQVYSYIYLCVYIIWFFLVNSRLRYVLPSPSLLDKAKENVLGMKIVRDQSGNTLMVSQSRFYNGKLVVCMRPDIASVQICWIGLIGLQKNVQVFVDFDYTMGRSITWCLEKGVLRTEVPTLVEVGALKKAFSGPMFQHWLKLVRIEEF